VTREQPVLKKLFNNLRSLGGTNIFIMPYSKPKNAKPAASRQWARGSSRGRPRKPVLSSAKSGILAVTRVQKKMASSTQITPTNQLKNKQLGNPGRAKPSLAAGAAKSKSQTNKDENSPSGVDQRAAVVEKSNNKRSGEEISISWLKPGKKAKLNNPSKSGQKEVDDGANKGEDGLIEIPLKKLGLKVGQGPNTAEQHKNITPTDTANPADKSTTKKTNQRKRSSARLSPKKSPTAIKKLNKTQKNKAARKARSIGKSKITNKKLPDGNNTRQWKASTGLAGISKEEDSQNSIAKDSSAADISKPPLAEPKSTATVNLTKLNSSSSPTTQQGSPPNLSKSSSTDSKIQPKVNAGPSLPVTKKRKRSTDDLGDDEDKLPETNFSSRKRGPSTKLRTAAYGNASGPKSNVIKQKGKPNARKFAGPMGLAPSDPTLQAKCQEQTALISMLKKTLADKEQQLKRFHGIERKMNSDQEKELAELKSKYGTLQVKFEKQRANINMFKTAIKKRDDDMEMLRAKGKEQAAQIRTLQETSRKRGKVTKGMDLRSQMQNNQLDSLVQNVANGLAEMRNMALEVSQKDKKKHSIGASPSKTRKEKDLKKKQRAKLEELKKRHGEKNTSLEKLRKQREEKKTQLRQIEDKMKSNTREIENLEGLKGAEGKRRDGLKNRIDKLRTKIQTSRSKANKRGLEKNLQELERQQSACAKLITSVNAKLQIKRREFESQRLNSVAYRDQVHALSRSIISDGHQVEKLQASITGAVAATMQSPSTGKEPSEPQKPSDVLKEVSNFPTLVQLEKLIAVWEKELKNLVIRFQLLLAQKQAALNKSKKQHQTKISALETKMELLSKEKTAATVNLQKMRKEIQAKSADMHEFKEGMDTTRVNLQLLQMEIKTRDAQIVLLKNEEGTIKGKIQQLQKGIQSRNLEVTKLRSQQSATRASVEKLRKDVKIKEAQITSLTAEKREYEENQKSALDRLKAELAKKTARITELMGEQGSKKEIIDRMTEEADKKDEQIANLTVQLTKSIFKGGSQGELEAPRSPTAEPIVQLSGPPGVSLESATDEIELMDFSGLAQRSFLRIREQRKRIRHLEMIESQLQEKGRQKASEMEKLLEQKNDINVEMGRLRTRHEDINSLNAALEDEMENIRGKIRAILDRPAKGKEVGESKWYGYPGLSIQNKPPSVPTDANIQQVPVPSGQPTQQAPPLVFSPPPRPPPNIFLEDSSAERSSPDEKQNPIPVEGSEKPEGSRLGDGRASRKRRRIVTIKEEGELI